MAWLAGWNIRKQLYLNGTTAGNQSIYQMKITINYGSGSDTPGNIYCNSQSKTDFSDIRFTDSSGNTLLYYWIESYSSGTNATVYVKIPNIPTGADSAYIYLYYNNPTPPSDGYNSGPNTFPVFFSNFSSGVLTPEWTINSVPCHSANISINYHSAPYSLVINVGAGCSNGNSYVPNPSTTEMVYKQATLPNSGLIFEYWGSKTSGSTYDDGVQAFIRDGSGAYVQIDQWCISSGTTVTCGWTFRQVDISAYKNQTVLLGFHGTNFNGLADHVHIEYFDDPRVRTYASPEPTWSSKLSSEQSAELIINSNPIGAEIWIAPHGGSYIDQGLLTNNTIGMSPGAYDIKLTKGGYQDWYSLNQSITTGQSITITASLFLISNIYGSIWVEGTDLRYIDTYGLERYDTGTSLGPVAGSVGSIWIENDQIAYIDNTGNKRILPFSSLSTVAGSNGSIWVQGSYVNYITSGIRKYWHTDVAHSDAHSDVAHSDAHSDVTHSDVAHADVAHSDAGHADAPHDDWWTDYGCYYGDTYHGDTAHADATYADVAHSDVLHTDVAHSDVLHTDVAHSDVAHTDVAHSDTPNWHTDHSDATHSDVTHSDAAHSDLP